MWSITAFLLVINDCIRIWDTKARIFLKKILHWQNQLNRVSVFIWLIAFPKKKLYEHLQQFGNFYVKTKVEFCLSFAPSRRVRLYIACFFWIHSDHSMQKPCNLIWLWHNYLDIIWLEHLKGNDRRSYLNQNHEIVK